MQIFVETLTSKAIAFDVMGMIQTIIKDAKTIEAEVVDANDSNASVQDKSQVNKVEEEAKAVNTSCELVASGHDNDALVEKTFPKNDMSENWKASTLRINKKWEATTMKIKGFERNLDEFTVDWNIVWDNVEMLDD